MRVLFPIDKVSTPSNLRELSNAFSDKEDTKYFAFFLSEKKNGNKIPDSRETVLEKAETQVIWQAEAERLQMNLDFIDPKSSTITSTSCFFADLLVVGSADDEALDFIRRKISSDTATRLGCAVCITGETLQNVGEIFILVDYDYSVAIALKSFVQLFLQLFKNKKITIVTTSPSNEEQIAFEQNLVNFVKEYSTDVGIVPIGSGKGYEHMLKLAEKAEHPLVIMGRSIREILNEKTIQNEKNKLSFYYFD
jgi:hypothetical protein